MVTANKMFWFRTSIRVLLFKAYCASDVLYSHLQILILTCEFSWETMRSRYNQSTPMFWFCCNRNFASLLYILQQPFQASAISGDVFRISLCFKVLPFLTGWHGLNKVTGTRDNGKECGLSWIPWPVSISLGCWLTSNITPQNTDPYRGSSSLFQ